MTAPYGKSPAEHVLPNIRRLRQVEEEIFDVLVNGKGIGAYEAQQRLKEKNEILGLPEQKI